MRLAILALALSACAPTIEERCRYRAKQAAQNAWEDKSARWCKRGDDGVERCWTPTAGDFYRMCMERAAK